MTNLKNQQRERIVLPYNSLAFISFYRHNFNVKELEANTLAIRQNETCQQIYELWEADRTMSIDTLLNTIELQFGEGGWVCNIDICADWYYKQSPRKPKEHSMGLACRAFWAEFLLLMGAS